MLRDTEQEEEEEDKTQTQNTKHKKCKNTHVVLDPRKRLKRAQPLTPHGRTAFADGFRVK